MNDDRVERQSLYTDRGSGWEVVSDQWEGRSGGELGAVSRHQARRRLEETALFVPLALPVAQKRAVSSNRLLS